MQILGKLQNWNFDSLGYHYTASWITPISFASGYFEMHCLACRYMYYSETLQHYVSTFLFPISFCYCRWHCNLFPIASWLVLQIFLHCFKFALKSFFSNFALLFWMPKSTTYVCFASQREGIAIGATSLNCRSMTLFFYFSPKNHGWWWSRCNCGSISSVNVLHLY